MNRSGQMHHWIMRAAGILLCMVLVSLYLVCGLFARYTTGASGSDGARVAKFRVTESGTLSEVIAAKVVPGVPYPASVEVTNDSEVAVDYTITVHQDSNNLPLQFSVGDLQLTAENGYSFTGAMAPGEVRTYILYIVWQSEGPEKDLENMGKVDLISIALSATQID